MGRGDLASALPCPAQSCSAAPQRWLGAKFAIFILLHSQVMCLRSWRVMAERMSQLQRSRQRGEAYMVQRMLWRGWCGWRVRVEVGYAAMARQDASREAACRLWQQTELARQAVRFRQWVVVQRSIVEMEELHELSVEYWIELSQASKLGIWRAAGAARKASAAQVRL